MPPDINYDAKLNPNVSGGSVYNFVECDALLLYIVFTTREMKYTCLFILSLLLLGCRHAKNNTNNEPIYKIGYTDLKIDGKLEDAVTNGTYVLALLEDKTVVVMDENMNRVKALEDNVNSVIGGKIEGLNIYKKDFLLQVKDGVLVFDSNLVRNIQVEAALKKVGVVGVGIGTADSSYFYSKPKFGDSKYFDINNYSPNLLSEKEISKRLKIRVLPFDKVYADSLYDIYACSMGEFGGRTFFVDRRTHRIYAIPAYSEEVFKLRGAYYLIQHEAYRMTKQTRVHDPKLLFPYELPIQTEKGVCCNCSSGDSIYWGFNSAQRNAWDKQHKIDNYFFSRDTSTLSSFIKNYKLYSLCSTDSTFLYVDITDSFRVLQVMPKMDRRIGKYNGRKIKLIAGKNTILGFNETCWQGAGQGYGEQITQAGFILLKEDSIKIYEHYSTKPYKFSERDK